MISQLQFLAMVCLFLSGGITLVAQDDLLAPDEFLETDYRLEFTPYHHVLAYVQHVAHTSPKVLLKPYGWTQEGRPLNVLVISSEKNIRRLESIRQNNLRLTGLVPGGQDEKLSKAIVWLNFGVHGNEAGATESSLSVLYELAKQDTEASQWLDNTIVLINPAANPDGFARYVNWNRSVTNKVMMPYSQSREHREPWPTGRVNHYQYDLNRDWAWATQKETKALLKIYHRWMPHVVVDFHEQFPENPYYFPPAAEPYHAHITNTQRDWQHVFGKELAGVFDSNGWLYFTKEVFDLFYPGYGDTYPMLNGAIGMTYEQAGHGIAGQAFLLQNADTLRISDRIEHHTAAAMATVKAAAQNAPDLIKGFRSFFHHPKEKYAYQSFVIKNNAPKHQLEKLFALLDLHHIQYGKLTQKTKTSGLNYMTGVHGSLALNTDDWVISVHQPMGVLASVLFDPEPKLDDSMTYDITAWALPYAFGLEAYAVPDKLSVTYDYQNTQEDWGIRGDGQYAWLVDWTDIRSASFLSYILQQQIQVRKLSKPITRMGKTFGRGSLLITKADNKIQKNQLPELLELASAKFKVPVYATSTGLSNHPPDLGAASNRLVRMPKVAVIYGDNISSYSYGTLWDFIDNELALPFVALPEKDLRHSSLVEYSVLVFPKGKYTSLNNRAEERIGEWINYGGKLILIGQAAAALNGEEGLALQKIESEITESEAPTMTKYANEVRNQLRGFAPGGLVKVHVDNTHPLAYGMKDYYYSVKTDNAQYQLLSDGWNVGYTDKQPKTIGFFGSDVKSKLTNNLFFGMRKIGEGEIIYFVDDPIFRGFWENGKLLLANAIF